MARESILSIMQKYSYITRITDDHFSSPWCSYRDWIVIKWRLIKRLILIVVCWMLVVREWSGMIFFRIQNNVLTYRIIINRSWHCFFFIFSLFQFSRYETQLFNCLISFFFSINRSIEILTRRQENIYSIMIDLCNYTHCMNR